MSLRRETFLNDFKVSLIQLDPVKTILVFAHSHNTYLKTKLLDENNRFRKDSSKTVDDFIHESEIKDFFTTSVIECLLHYEPGMPKYKPDVLLQMLDIEERRRKIAQQTGIQPIKMKDEYGNVSQLTPEQTIRVIHDLQASNKNLMSLLDNKNKQLSKMHYQLYNTTIKRQFDDLLLEINHLN